MANLPHKKYLTINYHNVAEEINKLHDSNYSGRAIKCIHKGKHARTERTIKIEVESMIGPFENWFYSNSKPIKYDDNNKPIK